MSHKTNPPPPKWEPSKWNDPRVRTSHNCYSYALDRIHPRRKRLCEYIHQRRHKPGYVKKTCEKIESLRESLPNKYLDCCDALLKPQPGQRHPGHTYHTEHFSDQYQCDTLWGKIAKDSDIHRIKKEATCPSGKHKIALRVAPNQTYHFYRQDSDGSWSHKDSSAPPSQMDASHHKMQDVETANHNFVQKGFTGYPDNCGYACVSSDTPIGFPLPDTSPKKNFRSLAKKFMKQYRREQNQK